MSSNPISNRVTQVLFPVVLVSALLLGACGGQGIDGGASVEAETEAQSSAGGDAAVAGEAGAEIGAEFDSEPGENSMETDAEMEAEAEAGAETEAYPELVLGEAAFHETDPSTVTLASGEVQFVEFFAYWCTVCKAIAPTVHGLEQIYGDRVNFVYLDRDNPATASLQAQLGYVYQPHIFLLDAEGNVLFESLSYVEGTVLQEAIEQALQ